MAKQRFQGFVGFIEGGIDVEECTDEYGDCHEIRVFRTFDEAAARYGDVRQVTITIEKRVQGKKGDA